MGLHRYVANKTLTLITNLIYKQKLTDMETAVKSFKTSLINTLSLKSDGFDIEPEIVKALSKARVKINEIPTKYNQHDTINKDTILLHTTNRITQPWKLNNIRFKKS